MGLSSINTGLQQTPDLTDIQTPGKLAFQFISLYNAIEILSQAIDTYTGNTPADAQGNYQNQTIDQTLTLGNYTSIWVTAANAITAGYMVSFSSGQAVLSVQNNANPDNNTLQNFNPSGIPDGRAMGIAVTSAGIGSQIKVMLIGMVNFGVGNLKPGAMYYHGSAAGSLTYNPTGMITGRGKQPLGFAIDSAHMFIAPAMFIGSY